VQGLNPGHSIDSHIVILLLSTQVLDDGGGNSEFDLAAPSICGDRSHHLAGNRLLQRLAHLLSRSAEHLLTYEHVTPYPPSGGLGLGAYVQIVAGK